MPAYLIFHEGNAFSFTVFAMMAVGMPLVRASAKACFSLIKIVAVDTLITWKLNASNFLSIGYGELHHQCCRRSADRCCLRSLPGCPVFWRLPTWQPPIPVLPGSHRHLAVCIHDNRHCPFGCDRHTHCCRDSLSQRTTGHIYTRDMFHIRMSLQVRTKMTQGFQIFYREISLLQELRNNLALYVLWTVQNDHDPLFSDLSDLHSSLQNTRYVKISAADKDPPGCPAFAA